ncbi:myb-binding protein 1a family member [Anaeramoeba flamelloides]|uniref:Myb-binding protein 1a family member n=1 Tax=Anaeramoeba flamelloides TaxID=1746091 RepID=A0AAV7ZSQ0_9EUKA|nr:myb-binding protein 1a family member [Anaeramoeba flamelloides]
MFTSVFSKLTSNAEKVRKKSTLQLFELLKEPEKIKVPLSKDPFEYSLLRLVRGVGSTQNSACQGFSLALTEFLIRYPKITTQEVLKKIATEHRESKSMKSRESFQNLLGRVFGYTCLLRSGRLNLGDNEEVFELESIIKDLIKISRKKSFLSQIAWRLITDIALEISTINYNKYILEILKADFLSRIEDYNAEMIYFLLKIESLGSKSKFKKLSTELKNRKLWKHGELLNKNNLTRFRSVLVRTNHSHPNIHIAWRAICESIKKQYMKNENSKLFQENFSRIWDFICEILLQNSNENIYLCFELAKYFLKEFGSSCVVSLLNEKFLGTFIDLFINKHSVLDKVGQSFFNAILAFFKNQPKHSFEVLKTIYNQPEGFEFLKRHAKKLSNVLFSNLDSKNVILCFDWIHDLFINTKKEIKRRISLKQLQKEKGKENEKEKEKEKRQFNKKKRNEMEIEDERIQTTESGINELRIWIASRIKFLTKISKGTPQTETKSEDFLLKVIKFTALHSMIDYRKNNIEKKIENFKMIQGSQIDEETRDSMRKTFLHLVLHTNYWKPNFTEKELKKKNNLSIQGMMKSGKLWISVILNFVKIMAQENSVFYKLSKRGKDIQNNTEIVLTKLDELFKNSKLYKKTYYHELLVYQILLINCYIQQIFNEFVFNKILSKLNEDFDAIQTMIKKKKNDEILNFTISILIQLISTNSPSIRSLISQLFLFLIPKMKKDNVGPILATITLNDDQILEDYINDSGEDMDFLMSNFDEDSENENENENENDNENDNESDPGSDSGSDSDNEEKDEKQIKKEENVDDDEEDGDDEQMLKMDGLLAQMAKTLSNKIGSNSGKLNAEAQSFRLKVFALVEDFFRIKKGIEPIRCLPLILNCYEELEIYRFKTKKPVFPIFQEIKKFVSTLFTRRNLYEVETIEEFEELLEIFSEMVPFIFNYKLNERMGTQGILFMLKEIFRSQKKFETINEQYKMENLIPTLSKKLFVIEEVFQKIRLLPKFSKRMHFFIELANRYPLVYIELIPTMVKISDIVSQEKVRENKSRNLIMKKIVDSLFVVLRGKKKLNLKSQENQLIEFLNGSLLKRIQLLQKVSPKKLKLYIKCALDLGKFLKSKLNTENFDDKINKVEYKKSLSQIVNKKSGNLAVKSFSKDILKILNSSNSKTSEETPKIDSPEQKSKKRRTNKQKQNKNKNKNKNKKKK